MCDVCGSTYKNKYYLKQHVQQCHPDSGPQFTCEQCQQVFKRQRDLRVRLGRTQDKSFTLHQCIRDRGYSNVATLLRRFYAIVNLSRDLRFYGCNHRLGKMQYILMWYRDKYIGGILS